jgi:cytochrome P450
MTTDALPQNPVQPDTPSAASLPPGPRLPVVVQTVLFGNYRHRWLPMLRRRHGDVIKLRLFPKRTVVSLSDLNHIKEVFAGPVSTFHAGEGNMILKPIMGEHSVLLTDEDVHLRAQAPHADLPRRRSARLPRNGRRTNGCGSGPLADRNAIPLP